MQDKPVIYVSNVTNLGEARYCAGMGVEMLGFVGDPSSPDFVTPSLYQEIMGWVSGPRRVIQLEALEETSAIAGSYAPEFVHVKKVTPATPATPCLLEISFSDLIEKPAPDLAENVQFILLTGLPEEMSAVTDVVARYGNSRKVLLAIPDGQDPELWLSTTGAHGLFLRGGKEISPGINDYERLAVILERFS